MTSCLTSTQKESTPMRTTSRLFGTVLVAAGLLAISASAAQAMPPLRAATDATDSAARFAATGHPGGPSLHRSGVMSPAVPVDPTNAQLGYHRVYGPQALYKYDAAAKVSSVMSPAVDRP